MSATQRRNGASGARGRVGRARPERRDVRRRAPQSLTEIPMKASSCLGASPFYLQQSHIMTFLQRKIDVQFQLGTGAFGEGGTDNTATVRGLRIQANITNTDGATKGNAQLRIYGLPPSLLNELSGLNQAAQAMRKNKVTVSAGDDVNGMATVFHGEISLAQVDLTNTPDSSLTVVAFAGLFAALKTAAPSSYPASADAAVIMADLAAKMGLGFENGGVSVILSTQYLWGTLYEQADTCARAANISWTVDIDKEVLAIWPRDGARNGAIPLISPETGLVGFPSYSSGMFQGLAVTTVFNPLLRVGKPVQIESSLKVANGTWTVFDITHSLESETPGGKWYTQFNASPFGDRQ